MTLRRQGRAKVKSFFGGEAGFWWSTISVRDFFFKLPRKLLFIIEVHYPDKTVQNFRASPVSCNLIDTIQKNKSNAKKQHKKKCEQFTRNVSTASANIYTQQFEKKQKKEERNGKNIATSRTFSGVHG